jgi:aerobic carbon-monoxide dehydrogenase medium subunit
MLLREVQYARPSTLEEAVEALASNPGARALAGGQTLVNVMKARAAAPTVLVDLNGLPELREISRDGDGLRVGAMVTYTQLMREETLPILAEVSGMIADVQVRNRGTLGGNICLNDPTNHFPPVIAALGARMHVRGRDGERELGSDEFFLGVYFTAVGEGELLTHITFPADSARHGFDAVTLGTDGTCIANAAAAVTDGRARVAIGCVAATPVIVETDAGEDAVREAVRGADIDPPSDVHASAEYRRQLAEVCAVRAVTKAAA